jgi:hypothetical protein
MGRRSSMYVVAKRNILVSAQNRTLVMQFIMTQLFTFPDQAETECIHHLFIKQFDYSILLNTNHTF